MADTTNKAEQANVDQINVDESTVGQINADKSKVDKSKSDQTQSGQSKPADKTDVEIETVIADAGKAESAAMDVSNPTKNVKKSKLGLFIIILLFVISASIGGLKLTGQLQPLYESLQSRLGWSGLDLSGAGLPQISQQEAPQKQPPQREASQADSSEHNLLPIKQPELDQSAAQIKKTNMRPEQTVQTVAAKAAQHDVAVSTPTPITSTAMPAVTSEEVSALLTVIDQLRAEMQQLESSQQSLRDGLLEQQQMNTQVRLRWIADPASRLPQMQLAWEEISLLPGLTLEQRQLAVDMHALARGDVQRLAGWKARLQQWAEVLVTPIHADILPKPEQPWLAWLVGQFQLRQAPSVEAKRLLDLRGRLLDAARQLSLESWPEQGAWQSLHAELLLQIKAMQHGIHGDDTVATGLPLDFSAIQDDINRLQQAAQQWSAADQQGGV